MYQYEFSFGVVSGQGNEEITHTAETPTVAARAPVGHLPAVLPPATARAFASSTPAPPLLMDSATCAAVQEPPSPQGMQRAPRVRACCGYGCTLNVVVFLAVTASFASSAYRSRHHPRDLAFVAAVYYLLALFLCCVAKLELLRDDPAAGDAQRRRARLAAWAVSVALSVTFAWRIADVMSLLPLKLAVWGVTAVFLGLGLYLFLCCAEPRRGQEDSGSRPAKASSELSPEEMA